MNSLSAEDVLSLDSPDFSICPWGQLWCDHRISMFWQWWSNYWFQTSSGLVTDVPPPLLSTSYWIYITGTLFRKTFSTLQWAIKAIKAATRCASQARLASRQVCFHEDNEASLNLAAPLSSEMIIRKKTSIAASCHLTQGMSGHRECCAIKTNKFNQTIDSENTVITR